MSNTSVNTQSAPVNDNGQVDHKTAAEIRANKEASARANVALNMIEQAIGAQSNMERPFEVAVDLKSMTLPDSITRRATRIVRLVDRYNDYVGKWVNFTHDRKTLKAKLSENWILTNSLTKGLDYYESQFERAAGILGNEVFLKEINRLNRQLLNKNITLEQFAEEYQRLERYYQPTQ